MPKSIRVLTEIGKDKSVQVDLTQEFDHLQILSLQFSQSELYQRQCSDYGVLVGRISVNNGLGIPNAKLGIFIPLDNTDANDPIISELYPYRTLNDTNSGGYQYNLLPQTASYSNHAPTGSFPTKKEIMEDYGWKKVYDKYYKFTVTTNQSGDFMIFGLPLGEHKLVMNLDLSDIGEFSLTPQDAIRMGIATESQVDGVRFKSSPNFRSLPQIVTIVKDVTILPLWGEEDLCQSSINRTDFDLSSDADTPINLQPTAVFMGSMISTLDRYSINKYKNSFCKVKLKMGELCKMTTGPGEILAIRHTIEQDSNGFPILEQYLMENNGKVIDPDGTWLVELPMNLNYVITDQFGNQVPSLDASAGVPTTARYRFKIKWQQPDNLNQDVKRGYFLVPNIKEWGWTTSNTDPNDPSLGPPPAPTSLFAKSYSFSLDWNDYGDSTPQGQQMIQEAILCEDRFYEFYYNKVYTVSQLIDQYRGGKLNRRYNSIKNILDEECESEVLKFPTNDAQFRPDFIYLLASIFLRVLTPVLIILLVVLHIIGFLLWLLAPVLAFIICVIGYIVYVICKIVNGVKRLLGGSAGSCQNPNTTCNRTRKDLEDMIKELRYFPLPNLTYPDCEMCNCTVEQAGPATPSVANVVEPILATRNFSQLSDWGTSTFYDTTIDVGGDFLSYYQNIEINGFTGDQIIPVDDYEALQTLASFPRAIASVLAGKVPRDTTGQTLTLDAFCPIYEAQDISIPNCDDTATYRYQRTYFSSNLPMNGRLNLFNTKAKYYNGQIGSLLNTAGTGFSGAEQGPNQIKVSFNYTASTNSGVFHYDNVLLLSCEDGSKAEFTAGKIITFQDLNNSSDVNALSGSTNNDEGIPCITGTTRTTPSGSGTISRSITYANPNAFNGLGQPSSSIANYTLVSSSADTEYHRWPIDIEYYQVITAMTISEYESLASPITYSRTTYPWTKIFPTGAPATSYYNFRLNNLQERVINGINLIRVYGNNNITRPDFYKWPNCTINNGDPIWGAEPAGADIIRQKFAGGGFRSFALSNFSLNTLGYNQIPDPQNGSFYDVFGDPKTYVFWESQQPVTAASLGNSQVLVFLVKGVDPYSTRNENSYDLSILFNKKYGTGPIITGKYKLNIPIQPTFGLVLPRHNNITQNNGVDSTTGFGIYYQNFNYIPGNDFSGFTSTNHRFYSSLDASKTSTQFGWYQNKILTSPGNPNATSGQINTSFPGGSYLCVSEPKTVTHGEFGVSLGFLNGSASSVFITPYGQSIKRGTKGGVGTNITLNNTYGRQVFLPKASTIVGNLFTTTFNWHAGSAIPWKYPTYTYGITVNEFPGFNQYGAPQFTNQTDYADFTFVGRFTWNMMYYGGLVMFSTYGGAWEIIFGSEESDGYWLPRLNVKMITSLPYQIPSYKTYDDPNGYYPREYVEGCELYAFSLMGSDRGTKNKVTSAGDTIFYPTPNPFNTSINTASFFYDNATPSYSSGQGGISSSDRINFVVPYGPFYHNLTTYYQPTMRLFSCSYQLPSSQSQDPSNVISTPLSFTNSSKDISVMRSDRLPTSDRTFQMRDVFQNSPDVVDYSFVLHNNPNFAIYTYDDDAIGLSAPPIVTGQNFPADQDVTANTASQMSGVIDTLNECNKMLPFNCYYNQDVTAPGVYYQTINADPNKSWKEGSCTSQNILGLGNRMIFDTTTGCYQLASRFILSLKIDIILLLEWKSRLDITFGACRNVFSHVFTNNWINGVLYAYSFKNDKIISRTNQITGYQYCTDTIYLHPTINTFYYRSSPWKYIGGSGQFIGKEGNSATEGGNRKYLGNPTTIMDLGPKTSYLQDIVFNDNFDGYIMKDLRDSTFGDTSDIINFFVLSRLINTNFLEKLTGAKGAGILGFFTRVKRTFAVQPEKQKNFIDADAAQLFSINSELGVDAFDVGNYPNADDTFYYGGSDAGQTVIGIFFTSDQQVRDFLTPKRTIFNPSTTQPSWPTSFGYIPLVKTQYVPFYNWKLKPIPPKNWIFGSQESDWATNDITAYYYQSLDRLNVTQVSNYMSPVPNLPIPRFSEDFRGYIFNYNPQFSLNDPDIIDTNPYNSGSTYNNNNTSIPKEVITHGSPFHFYFGLKKGKTALDRFLTKYTQDTDLI